MFHGQDAHATTGQLRQFVPPPLLMAEPFWVASQTPDPEEDQIKIPDVLNSLGHLLFPPYYGKRASFVLAG